MLRAALSPREPAVTKRPAVDDVAKPGALSPQHAHAPAPVGRVDTSTGADMAKRMYRRAMGDADAIEKAHDILKAAVAHGKGKGKRTRDSHDEARGSQKKAKKTNNGASSD